MGINFLKMWCKRLLLLPTWLSIQWRIKRLRARGAKMADGVHVSSLSGIEGDFRFLTVDQGCFIGRIKIALHQRVSIGKNVCVNDGVQLLTASHDTQSASWQTLCSEILIEDYVWIANGAMILPGVKIGRGAVIGAGAVVAKNVEAYEIVVGNPARPTGKKRVDHLEYSPVSYTACYRAWHTNHEKETSIYSLEQNQ
jgi:acetyltransferase-like isoleucine patch superfamily enzyme